MNRYYSTERPFYINVRMRENHVDMRFLMHETVISLVDIDKSHLNIIILQVDLISNVLRILYISIVYINILLSWQHIYMLTWRHN